MAKRKSAGILMYRKGGNGLEVFLVHPGGPFWMNKDAGAWSIPKGEFDETEAPLTAALREFSEETGTTLNSNGPFIALMPVVQKGGKQVFAWAFEGNIDAAAIQCNTFKVEWPYKSGQWKSYPEVDKAEWFSIDIANEKINAGQKPVIKELLKLLS